MAALCCAEPRLISAIDGAPALAFAVWVTGKGGSGMKRSRSVALVMATMASAVQAAPQPPGRIEVAEASIPQLQAALASGAVTSRQLVQAYLARIAAYDSQGPALNSIVTLNPAALAQADALDKERASKGPRGPLHGIPVLIKDNIDTADQMRTSAGSLALAAHKATQDAFIVKKLREAGAVVLGKTNLSEWANFRSTRSTSGWSSPIG